MSPLVVAALVSAGPSTLTTLLSYRLLVHGRWNKRALHSVTQQAQENKESLQEVSEKAQLNQESLQRVEKATNGVLTARIREVLRDELIRHAATTQEMQQLLDLILRGVQGEEDTQ